MNKRYRLGEPATRIASPTLLGKKVRRLEPRQAPYADASAAFLQGRNTRCLSLLHGNVSADAALLRARAALRLRRFDVAYDELTKAAIPLGDHPRCAEQQYLLETTFARTGRFDEAHRASAFADVYATSSGDCDVVTEAAAYHAFTAFLCGDYDRVEAIATAALDERSGAPHARLLEMLSLVAALGMDIERHIALLYAANEHLVKLPARDIYLEANMLSNLAVPVVETEPTRLAGYIRNRASEIPWHDELQLQHFHVTHYLGWLDALLGDDLSAFRRFRAAADLAPTPARRADAFVSRGVLAREMGESISAAECVADAEEQIARVDWDATRDDERIALLQFGALIAPLYPKRAARHVERYKAISQSINRFDLAGHGDPLFRATKANALGVVARYAQGRASAVPLLQDAHAVYRSVSSNWRAALVALDLFELEGDPGMLAFAQNESARLPRSWLARRLDRTRQL